MRPVIYSHKSSSGREHAEGDGAKEGAGLPVAVSMVDYGEAGDDLDDAGGASDAEDDVVGYGSPARRDGSANPRASDRSLRSQGLRHITADRPIFTLSVAADLLGLHPRTLRIYEEKKLVVPARTNGNRRRYSQIDIEKLQAIRLLTRGGVNLEGVRIILDMSTELLRLGGDPTSIIEHNLQGMDQLDEQGM